MTFELDKWPLVQAKNYKNTNGRKIRVVVIHDMEAPEKTTTAENVAKWFAGSTAPMASAHLCIDSDSIVRSVKDEDVAYHAPGANNDGIGLELAGYARQTENEWLDTYSKAVLENAAKACAQYSLKYGVPVVHLSNSELGSGKKGFVGHRQVSATYKKSDHADPGENFPWTYFMQRINFWLPYYKNGRKWPSQPAPAAIKTVKVGDKIPGTNDRWLGLTNPPLTGQDVKNVQHALNVAGNTLKEDGVYKSEDSKVVQLFKDNRGITEAGVHKETWAALREVVH